MEQCLQKSVAKRFQDIGDVNLQIEKVLADTSGVLVQSVGEVVQSAPPSKLPWLAAIGLAVVIGGATVWVLRPIERHPVSRSEYVLPDGRDFRRTARPVLSFSSDGSQFVYNTSGGVYLRSIDELESRVISGTEDVLDNPSFSPDMEWLAFYSPLDRKLKKIATVGGATVTLTDVLVRPSGISWDVDDTILFQAPEGIMRVSAVGGEPELLLPRLEEAFIGNPQLLPGGNAVLFDTSSGQVGVQSLDSGEAKLLFPGGGPRYVSTGHIVYEEAGVLFAVPFDLGTLEVTGGPVPLVDGVGIHYALSDSGALAYVPDSVENAERTLALVDRMGRVERVNIPPKAYLSPRLSPDGATLAVQSVENSGNIIWTYDLTGDRAIQQLTFEGDNHRPTWTPDSQRITFEL